MDSQPSDKPNGDDSSRAENLFARALEVTAGEERERFLAEACGDDAELRREVERLLTDAEKAKGLYDNDGDLDVLLAGLNASFNDITRIYRNDGKSLFNEFTFRDIEADLPGIGGAAVAWGDYDNDGDLDVLMAGWSPSSGRIARIYRNDGEDTFENVSVDLQGIDGGSVDWGDYDRDGDLDILLAGDSDAGRVTKVYRNDDAGLHFTDIGADLPGLSFPDIAVWGDYDNDSDLDIALAANSGIAAVYRNEVVR